MAFANHSPPPSPKGCCRSPSYPHRPPSPSLDSVHKGKPFYDTLVQYMSSGRVIAMELVAEDAINKWRTLLGPTDVEVRARAGN